MVFFFPRVVVSHRGYSGSGRRRAFRVEARRQERENSDFSSQIQGLIDADGTAGRIALSAEPGALGKAGAAVNKLLEDLENRYAQLQDRAEQLFQRLVEHL